MITVNHLTWSGCAWWRYDMGTLSTLLALCEGNPLVTSGFPSQTASNAELFYFFFFVSLKLLQAEEVVEQIIKLPDIWAATVLMWHHGDGIWVCEASLPYLETLSMWPISACGHQSNMWGVTGLVVSSKLNRPGPGFINTLRSEDTYMNELTHWGRDKMAAIFQMIFSNGYSWMKMYEFRLTFHWSLFLGVQLHEPRIYYPSGHWPETVTNAHVSAHFH